MAASTQSETDTSGHPPRCLNSTDIAKLFQPQWENTDHVKPIASYSAANLYNTGNVEVASSSSLIDPGGLDDSIPDLGSTPAKTEASNDDIDEATTATTVDNDEDHLASTERPSKQARIDAYYPLAMARQQNRAAQLQFRRRKASPTNSSIEDSSMSKGSVSLQNDHTFPRSTAISTSTDRWYYPAAMVQQAQSMYDRPSTLPRASSSNNPHAIQQESERNPGYNSHQPESSTSLIYSQQSNGIYGRFFNRNLQPRPMSALEKDQLRNPPALQHNTNAADIASVQSTGESRYTERWPFLTSGKAVLDEYNPLQPNMRTRDNWYYPQALSPQSATPLSSDNWWDIPGEQKPVMNIHEISDTGSSTVGLSVELPPSHGGHNSVAPTDKLHSTARTRQPGVYGGPFSSQHEPPGLSVGQTSNGGIYGGFFDYKIQDFRRQEILLEQQNKLAREKAIMEKKTHDDHELATHVTEYAKTLGVREPFENLKGFYAGFFLSQQQNKKRLMQARKDAEEDALRTGKTDDCKNLTTSPS